jgi:hypothetical protein
MNGEETGHLPRRAGKRTVQKPDGRYLIYYEKTPVARRATS